MENARALMKVFNRRTLIVCLIGLSVLILSCGLLFGFGLYASSAREADYGRAKMDSIEELMAVLRADEKERSSTRMKENNERITGFMADALRVFMDGDEYTGPRVIGEGIVIEMRENGVIYPEDMEKGYVSLSGSQIDRMRRMQADDMFLGFMTEEEEDPEHNQDWARLDAMSEEEETILAALFCAKMTDRYYYLEHTSRQELYEYINLYTGYRNIIRTAEQAYSGAILNIDLDDLQLNNESYYFPGITEAGELGITKEMIETRYPAIVINGVRYQCTYGSYSPTEILIYLHSIEDLTDQSIGDVLLLGAVILLILITVTCYLISVLHRVQRAEEPDLESVRKYEPARLKRILTAGGILGIVLAFLFASLVQSMDMLYTETISSTSAVDILTQQLKESETEKRTAMIEEEQDWYIYYGNQFASLLAERPELSRKEMLQAFCKRMGIDYLMLFDENGIETACSRDYYGFAMGTEKGGYLYEFRRLLMGISSVKEEVAQDEITGEIQQKIGVSIPFRSGKPGALVMFLPSDLAQRDQGVPNLDSHLRLLTTSGTFCFTADTSGVIVEDSNARFVGNTVMQYGLPENSLRDGFMSFFTLEGRQYYLVTAKRDTEVHYYATEVSSLFGKSALYGLLAATAFTLAYFVLIAGLMKGYRAKVFPAWAQEMLRREETASARITSNHEKAYSKKERKRWNLLISDWRELLPEERAREIFCLGLSLLLLICLAIDFSANQLSLLRYILTGDWMRGLNVFSVCAILMTLLLSFLITYIFRRMLLLVTRFQSGRAETICRLIYSFAEFMLVLVTIYFCLTFMGFPTAAVLTSAGLTTLALTFGAQGMVADILAGVAIVFEGDFQVGDIVELEGFWGHVEEIGIRTTKLVNRVNDVRIIENSQIKNLVNKTKYYSRCDLRFNISKEESLIKVEALLDEQLPRIREKHKEIISGPALYGVSKVLDKSIVPYVPSIELMIVAFCREDNKNQLICKLNRDLYLMFRENGINLV